MPKGLKRKVTGPGSVLFLGILLLCAAIPRADDAAAKQDAIPRKAAPTPESRADVRDMLLLLDDGPLHLRFRLSLEGQPLTTAREAYVDKLMRTLDTDGDGKLTQAEAARSPLLTTRRRDSATGFLESLGNDKQIKRSDIQKSVDRVGGEMVVLRENASAADNDREVFKFLDVDSSGFIERTEMEAASAKILERDGDQDDCISFQEFMPPPDPQQMNINLVGMPRPDRAAPKPAEMLRDMRERLLKVRMLEKYDRDHDRKLSPEELGWDASRIAPLDINRDGKLDARELEKLAAGQPDLVLAVDLAGPTNAGEPLLRILNTTGHPAGTAKRPDLVRIAFPTTILTLSFRQVDPIKSAIEKAMRDFNTIDTDANGYLDARETANRDRFERGLFDTLDADGDGKIFGEEIEKYVALRGEPAATTAWINLYDTGRGLFETLDANGDGRISIREMRGAEKSLSGMRRTSGERLSPDDPVRNFHLELLRGSYQLFGPIDRMVAQTPTFEQRSPVGPIWFQRMDRNNDGDLTWNEFLGPRDVFHRIDTDGDGLIDPQEAARVSEE